MRPIDPCLAVHARQIDAITDQAARLSRPRGTAFSAMAIADPGASTLTHIAHNSSARPKRLKIRALPSRGAAAWGGSNREAGVVHIALRLF
jgi:hypothetical protein